MSKTDIEIGTTRSLATAGRDVVRAATGTAKDGSTWHVAKDGRRVAVILPCGSEGQVPSDVELDALMGHLAGRMEAGLKPGAECQLARLLGRALARYFRYDGDDILAAAAYALEESNWHGEAAELRGMITAEG